MSRGFLIHKLAAKMLAFWARCGYDPGMDCDCEDEETCLLGGSVPQDVKKGHFVVYAVDGGELRRFVLKLSYLAHPGFLKLLEQAEREFGFKQTGILAIPCGYSDLVSVLQSKA
ncbi:auxin-responsive protein SAUR50-like [Salvia divinorum]|uniref:Auxin-responsive protein SAUR50-like n=1 Tax=Salvia divinorum TaxID=28513 RepID=A0ABD1IBB7_SALDI